MDRRRRLAEHGECGGVRDVDAGQLEVVGARVRRNALQQELAEVRVLALVAVERHVQQPDTDHRDRAEDEGHDDPDPPRFAPGLPTPDASRHADGVSPAHFGRVRSKTISQTSDRGA